ncbi:MAG: hypothetical protein NT001_06215 [Candidatus Woesearchaeota archaeon]|nr:hypothetical protein [Candidatus Woesearchaeota archaeon]
MNKKKLKKDIKLLEKSIKLWEKHNLNQRSVKGMKIYTDSCPLCLEYNKDEDVDIFACQNCPLVEEGFEDLDCGEKNSPWMKVYKLTKRWERTGKKPKELKKAVEQMIWSLKCLMWDYKERLKGKTKIDMKRVIRNIEKNINKG